MTQKRVAVVAGVGPGNGLAIAKRFARDGWFVAMIARDATRLAEYQAALTAVGGAGRGYVGNLADVGDTARVMAEIIAAEGPIGVLVYNAGVWREASAMTIAPKTFADDLTLSVTAGLVAAQAVYPGMRDAGSGTMLFTGGGLALAPQYGTPVPSLTAGKSALRGLVLAMAAELRPQGIRVGTVTIAGTVAVGTAFDPDVIAERFAALAALPPSDETVEVVFDGSGA
jgi:NAD(P)-dependent dehydrogenase (short-subunit alcohol dehydrogenase family)